MQLRVGQAVLGDCEVGRQIAADAAVEAATAGVGQRGANRLNALLRHGEVTDRLARLDDRKRGHAQHDAVERGDENVLLLSENTDVCADGLALVDKLTRRHMEAKQPAGLCAEPAGFGDLRLVRGQGREVVGHAQFRKNVEHAAYADFKNGWLDFAGFAGFENDRRDARLHCGAAQGAVGALAIDDQFASERLGQASAAGVLKIGANIGEIGSSASRRVKIKAEIAETDDAFKESKCDAPAQ